MKRPILIAALMSIALIAGASSAIAGERKTQTLCGWFENPTPGNASLQDRSAEWVIGIQGGHQAEGEWPEFGPSQWIQTNRSYGYGCACIKGVVDTESKEVITIVSARAQPLKVCRQDRALKKPAD